MLALLITLLTGAMLFGTDGIDLALPGRTAETMGGLFLTFGFATPGLMVLAAITLLLACLFNFGATIMLALTLLVIMSELTQFAEVTPYLLTHAWNAVNHSLHSTTKSDVLTALWVLILYLLAGIGLAFWLFERKDIMS